jgi:hypothetical protein
MARHLVERIKERRTPARRPNPTGAWRRHLLIFCKRWSMTADSNAWQAERPPYNSELALI